jgi:hypothetical protein
MLTFIILALLLVAIGTLATFAIRWYRAAIIYDRKNANEIDRIRNVVEDMPIEEVRSRTLQLLSNDPFFYTEPATGREYIHPSLPESIRELFSTYALISYTGVVIEPTWLTGLGENPSQFKIGVELDDDIVVVPGFDDVFVGPEGDEPPSPESNYGEPSIFHYILDGYLVINGDKQ